MTHRWALATACPRGSVASDRESPFRRSMPLAALPPSEPRTRRIRLAAPVTNMAASVFQPPAGATRRRTSSAQPKPSTSRRRSIHRSARSQSASARSSAALVRCFDTPYTEQVVWTAYNAAGVQIGQGTVLGTATGLAEFTIEIAGQTIKKISLTPGETSPMSTPAPTRAISCSASSTAEARIWSRRFSPTRARTSTANSPQRHSPSPSRTTMRR